ncbi:MAG: hypothetical protein DPW16_12455 [Chloroflexi bacterium]|nr:hypothetical protein [Chloroflexota bacterium]
MWIKSYQFTYQRLVRPLLFGVMDAQTAHERILSFLAQADQRDWVQSIAQALYRRMALIEPIQVGGVTLDFPLILAAGFVKGQGYATEDEAIQAVERGENIIPGWRTMPNIVGAVEFGSFTRYPRLGNAGQVIWRDTATRSTQNRVGLKNPGAQAASLFLAQHPPKKPFGINLAVSPQVTDPDQEEAELVESLQLFLDAGVLPDWFTLNLSCPNTEDDPRGHQTEEKARHLCRALLKHLDAIPLWAKISPCLSAEQYAKLIGAFAAEGVRAVIATNTLPQPTPNDTQVIGGVGGGRLHTAALDATRHLMAARPEQGYPVDVIGCGGVMDAKSYQDFRDLGVQAVQYWSALVYQGLWAYAVILRK